MNDSTPTVRSLKIDHITIVVSDLDRSADFYSQVLGMKLVERPNFPIPGRWLQLGDIQIHLNLAGEAGGEAGLPYLNAKPRSNGFHYAFAVDDCDAAAERLCALGHEVFDGPRSRPDGVRQCYLYDPDGHLLEICTPLPSDNDFIPL